MRLKDAMHLSEDDLILHYYGEGAAADDEARVAQHLDVCEPCRGAFDALRRVMEMIDAAPVPEPGPAFERTVWAKLQNRDDFSRLAGREKSSRFFTFAFAGGLAAVILAVILWQFDLNFSRTAPGAPQAATADADAHRSEVLLTAVSDHIEQSQLVLVELANAEPQDAALDVSLERTAADDLVSAGRLYRETARQTGDLELAALLDDLELVLVEIARGPEALSAQQLEDLRAQIDQQELIFKLRVLAADVEARQQQSLRPSPGPLKRTL